MSGGGGSSQPAQPSTTTQIQDIPAWEQGYVTDLLGKAQAISNQPYQQFPGQQIAGFTDPQMQAFSNIEGAGDVNSANQSAAMGQAGYGANTANNIYGAGAGDINAATGYNPLAAVSPYLGAAAGYNSAAASQPWLGQAAGYEGMAANAATPQGIQNYMSPYTNSVVQGLQNEANLNWNQNIMPGINDKFVGSGQYGSGRNAQVLGQAAGNFQTGLSSNIANALESGYNTAGSQAANQAQLLAGLGGQSLTGASTAGQAQSQQVANLLNQGAAAGTATQQQAGNLQNAGTALGNLASTQGTQQLNAANTLGNLGAQAATTNLNQNTALQAVGQQQQQLNQTNLNTAMQDWQNQTNWPAQQTQYLNQIIRGLPTPAATTSSTQATPAYSVSPLSGIGGSLASVAGLAAQGKKKGGLIKGYAAGGQVDEYDPTNDIDSSMGYDNDQTPLDYANAPDSASQDMAPDVNTPPQQSPLATAAPQSEMKAPENPLDNSAMQAPQTGLTPAQYQQQQLLALARGMLTPSLGGSTAAAFGQGLGNMQEIQQEQMKAQMAQQNLNYQRNLENKRIGIEQQNADTNKGYKEARINQLNALASSGGKGSVSQWKYNTWLAAHPDDTEGALAYASGHKTMDDAAINKNAVTMASKDALGIDPDGEMTPEEKTAAYKSLLKNGTLPQKIVKAKPAGFFDKLFGTAKSDNSGVLTAPPPMSSRVEGHTYNTPKGPLVWSKDGWISGASTGGQ